MPKAARSLQEIGSAKDRILEAALTLMIDQGFSDFSMRKLGRKVGMTAANLYNYFTSKDELYLMIQTRGFEMLHARMAEAGKGRKDDYGHLEAMIRAYIEFGTRNAEYYEIMFSRNTPKYADYIGTAMEPVALHEKSTALTVAELTVAAIAGLPGFNAADARRHMLRLWCLLNGLVNLINSRVLQEVEHSTEKVVEGLVEDILEPLRSRQEVRP